MTARAETVVVRRRLLGILAVADRPLSTPDIRRQMAQGGRNCNSYLSRNRQCSDVGVHPGKVCRAWCWHQPVYPQLRVLEQLGLVARVRYPNRESIERAIAKDTLLEHLAETETRVVYWSYTADDSDAAMNKAIDDAEALDSETVPAAGMMEPKYKVG